MDETWVPEACTLSTVERPVRVAEFDALLGGSVRRAARRDAGRLRLELDPSPDVAATAANLAARETACCSFFTFTLTASGGALRLDVAVPEAHTDVLDALARRVPS